MPEEHGNEENLCVNNKKNVWMKKKEKSANCKLKNRRQEINFMG